ncbi:capsid maturation protease [Microbacterium phage Smarties]|uniref:Capsid maturation protease n=1 Tax=Microbacterium phage Ariadne TaxID=2656546 RepID=A0A649VAR7_9CAUD|nr:capsid maturation protease [Microbacterium phage Ariadne]QGJ89437.1 capsid maturation protease [Microbacterium phage Ariadne]QGJ91424.1 capsid maturation protease [Microbacterium phage Smarties]
MSAFDRIRQADARRRIQGDVRSLMRYSMTLADAPADDAPADIDFPESARWEGIIGYEDQMTGDGRMIAGDALVWDFSVETPNLRYVKEDVGAHDNAVTVGKVLGIERRDGGAIWAHGDFDMASEDGREAYRQVSQDRQNGVSMDMDDVSFEVRIAGELYDEMQDMMATLFDEDGEPEEQEEPDRDGDGRVTVAEIHSDDEVMVTTAGRIRALTIVAVPAFAGARIGIAEAPADSDDSEDEDAPAAKDEMSLVAAAAPVAPPAAWFDKPKFSGPTPLTITPEGRVYGHAALWGTCHLSHTSGGQCVSPPNSPSNYAWFHTGALETEEGTILSVGHLTMGTGHAGDRLSAAETAAHYDNTGRVAADVRMYEDEWGMAFAGGLRPGLTPAQVREFRAAPISGDWRRVGGAMEFVAGLSVNVPGFGVPRLHGRIEKDELQSLVASGIIVDLPEPTVETLSTSDIRYLRAFADRERKADLDRLAARRNRVKVDRFARRRKGK